MSCRQLQPEPVDFWSLSTDDLAIWAMLFSHYRVALLQDPIDNLYEHVASPWLVNFTTNNVSLPFQAAVTAPY